MSLSTNAQKSNAAPESKAYLSLLLGLGILSIGLGWSSLAYGAKSVSTAEQSDHQLVVEGHQLLSVEKSQAHSKLANKPLSIKPRLVQTLMDPQNIQILGVDNPRGVLVIDGSLVSFSRHYQGIYRTARALKKFPKSIHQVRQLKNFFLITSGEYTYWYKWDSYRFEYLSRFESGSLYLAPSADTAFQIKVNEVPAKLVVKSTYDAALPFAIPSPLDLAERSQLELFPLRGGPHPRAVLVGYDAKQRVNIYVWDSKTGFKQVTLKESTRNHLRKIVSIEESSHEDLGFKIKYVGITPTSLAQKTFVELLGPDAEDDIALLDKPNFASK